MIRPRPLTDLTQLAAQVRGAVVRLAYEGQAAHVASALSCVDVLVASYFGALRIDPKNPDDPNRDRFILSKGHAASALYVTLAARGFFPMDELDRYAQPGTRLPEQPAPGSVPGVEFATGSLGHGLPVGCGMALAARLAGRDSRVTVLMSDGECNEGSVWEAAMFASAQRLRRLTVIVDANGWQATGRTKDILPLEPLVEKFRAFGWDAEDVDGHDVHNLRRCLEQPRGPRPRAWIARTVKGKGVSFMEDDNNWHYRVPTAEEVDRAEDELGGFAYQDGGSR